MSLVPDYADSSSSSSSSASSENEEISVIEQRVHLPTPDFDGTSASVFRNPFMEAENAKEAILQQHVKMVNTRDAITINGRKICWNYRKGKCRFGHNCKFAHDSDIQKTETQLKIEKDKQCEKLVVCQKGLLTEPSKEEMEKIQMEGVANRQKRKRQGLTQGLVPGKKVLKKYFNQKS